MQAYEHIRTIIFMYKP